MEDGEEEIEGKVMLPGGWHDLAEFQWMWEGSSQRFLFLTVWGKLCRNCCLFRLEG